MNKILILTIALFTTSCLTAQMKVTQKSFPTNFDSSDFEILIKWDGKIIAFDGIIKQEKVSRNDTPFYLLELGENEKIWTTLMFKNEVNKTGDKIRVVGYLTEIKDKKADEDFLNDDKYMVIAFGLVDFKNENFLFLGGADIQKKEWIEGKIPTQ